jgi:hypothetical protein
LSKVLKTVAVVAAVVALTFAIPGVGTAIGTALGVSISAGTAATVAAVASAVSALATVGAQKLQKPPDMKGTVNEVVIGSNMPVPYVMGRTFVGGMKVYDNVAPGPNGHPNKDRTHIFVGTHAGPIDSFEKFQADYTPITFASETGGLISGVASGYYGADGGYLWLNTRKGLRPDTALTAPAGRAAITGWTSAHKLSGMACWSATMEFDEEGERWSSGIPAFGMVAKWVWAYDPRLDSSYSGGSGPQRWSDESTWAWTENPALHAITYVRGRFMNGIKVVGAGIPQNAVNIPAFVELANICDANAWKVGGAVYEGPGFSRWDNLKRILQAASAEPVWVGGLLSCRFSSPKTTLVQINSDDLADGDIEVQAMSNFKDRHNTLVPRYRSEPHKWEYVQADAVQNTTYLAEDGETKTDEVQYDLVQNKDQAAQLAAYELANRREFGPIRITCKNHLRTFKPGEAVTLNISEAGLVSQLAVITSRTVDPSTGSVQFELVSETTAKHAYALGKTGVAPATPTIIAPQDVDAAVSGFDADVTGSQTAVGDGNRIRFSLFENGTAGFANLYDSAGIPLSLSRAIESVTGKAMLATTGTFTAAGQIVSIGSLGSAPADSAFRFTVDGQTPERIYIECKPGISAPAGSSFFLGVGFLNAAGGILLQTQVVAPLAFSSWPNPIGDFVPVPAGAVGGWVELYLTSGAAGAFTMWFSEPMVTSAAAGQTTHPNFVPGPSSEPGASVTTNIAVQNPITIAADSAGVPKSGQLRSIALKLMRSGTALTSAVTWAATTLSGTATYTISGTGTGTLTLTGPNNATLSAETVVRITATYLGATSTYDTKIVRQDDQGTNSGSTGGGGGNPGTTGNTTSFDIISTTNYATVQGSGIVTAKAGTAGRVDCTFPGGFTRTPGTSNGQTSLAGKIQWRIPGGTFADLSAGSQASTLNAKTLTPSGDPPDNQDGTLSVSDALTGKTPGDTFEFVIVFFKTNVSGTSNDVVPGGLFQCVGS